MSSLLNNIEIYDKVFDYCETHGEHGELEQFIATHAVYSYLYARHVIGERFELGEEVIATDVWSSYRYAKNVIGGRFELGEGVIATHAWFSYLYAKNVISGRFELGEKAIFEDEGIKQKYQEFLESLCVVYLKKLGFLKK